jgi:hypothetical protein
MLLLCGLSWTAGLIHISAAVSHFRIEPAEGVFFELLATAQLLWGLALYRSPSRRLLSVGFVVSLAVVALWMVSRTCGIPLGDEPWH